MSNVRVRELTGVRAVTPSEAAPADLALINSEFARSAIELTADDLHIRQARVAHNYHDRTGERFQKVHLERFAETLPGRSLIIGHDTRTAPIGRWFRADTRTRGEDFPVLQTGKKDAEIIPGFETDRQRVTWLEAAFYFANDPGTELQRKNIDAGVWQDVSIGFAYDTINCDICKADYLGGKCPHIFMQRDSESGVLATGTYSGEPKAYEARETSIVYLGAQQQAELMKSVRDGTMDPEKLAETSLGADLVALKHYEHLARIHGHQRKSWHFKISAPIDAEPLAEASPTTPASVGATGDENMELKKLCELLGLPATATEDDVSKAVSEVHAKAKTLDGVNLETLKTDAGKAAEFKPLAEIGTKALEDLKALYLAHCGKLGDSDSDLVEKAALADGWVEQRNYARLKEMVDLKWAAVCAKYPVGPSGKPGADGTTSTSGTSAESIRSAALA